MLPKIAAINRFGVHGGYRIRDLLTGNKAAPTLDVSGLAAGQLGPGADQTTLKVI